MKKNYVFLIFLLLTSCMLIANDKTSLTIWIRSFGNESAHTISSYLIQIEKELSADFELKIIVATKYKDPVLEVLEEMQLDHCLTILQTNLDSLSQGLNNLIKSTSTDCYVLSLSQGVNIHANYIKDALSWLRKGAWVYGWQLSNLHNDGSIPGKG